MFIADRPIETENHDFLGRTRFSKDLGQSIIAWGEKESLVIALYGEWGSGKSSVINLMKEHISNSELHEAVTIIEFNPWIFSDLQNLTKHFFNEIAKELELKLESDKDKKIAHNLRLYSKLLNLAPEKSVLKDLQSKIILGLGLVGISSIQLIQWLGIPQEWVKYILFSGGFLMVLIELFKGTLSKWAQVFEQQTKEKTISELKNEIRKELLIRGKKLLIVIDDIDRLNQSEIREVFRLVRINADFPNTVYLLSFDRKIIERSLEEQVGFSGKDYLEKIVQVNFDIPVAPPIKIAKYLFSELDRVLATLPKTSSKYFDDNNTHWTNIYHSGFKNFFQNIRDVKRYSSSLEFNLSQIYQAEILEVNPIDFMTIEAIRVFASDFYEFMKSRKELFTSTDRETRRREENPTKLEIEKAINNLHSTVRESVRELIRRLFPQIDSIFTYGYSSYGGEWHSVWGKELRVCSSQFYDSYFTLLPGGDMEELSQFEIHNILASTISTEDFEMTLKIFLEKNKIRKVLTRIQDFTSDLKYIPQDHVPFIVQALFNLSDQLPDEKLGFFDFGSDMEVMRIIHQLLIRDADRYKNYELLKEVIRSSTGLYGPVHKISIESLRAKKGKPEEELVIPLDKLNDLEQICLDKIKDFSLQGKLLGHKKLINILYRWKEWDKEKTWERFIAESLIEDSNLITFVEKLVSETQSQSIGDYGVKNNKEFNYKSLKDFYDPEEIRNRLKEIKDTNISLYEVNREIIDLFLDNFDRKDQTDFD